MECKAVTRLLNRYIDKETADKEAVALIEAHLKICALCKKEFELLVFSREFIAKKEKLETDNTFLIRLTDRLEREGEGINLRWVIDIGELSKRLIPVPLGAMVLTAILLFGNLDKSNLIDEYLLESLSDSEMEMLK